MSFVITRAFCQATMSSNLSILPISLYFLSLLSSVSLFVLLPHSHCPGMSGADGAPTHCGLWTVDCGLWTHFIGTAIRHNVWRCERRGENWYIGLTGA